VEEACDVDEAALVELEEIALLTAAEKKKKKNQRERGKEALMDTDSWHIQPFGGQGRRLARPKYI
jgi:hypothetical protein